MPSEPLSGTLCLPKGHFSDDAWHCEPFSRGQAWVDLWALANDRQRLLKIRGVDVTVKRGQVAWAIQTLGERWRWSKDKVRSFLSELQDARKIIVQGTNLTTVITVIDYTVYNPDTAPELSLEPTPETSAEPTAEPTPETSAEPTAEPTPETSADQSAEPTQKRGSREEGSREEEKRGSATPRFPEIPSDEKVRDFCCSWQGDLSRGIPGSIPEVWWLDWLAYWLTREQFPRDWQRSLVLKFTSDWVKGDAKARGVSEKKAAAPGSFQTHGRPSGWREGDAEFWWSDAISKVEAALAGALLAKDEKNAARIREVLNERTKSK